MTKIRSGLVPNSRRGQLEMMGRIDAMDTTGFYFDHDTKKFKINITSIKIDNDEQQRNLNNLTNYPLEKFWSIDIAILLDSCPLHNPLHTMVLHLTTIVIHLVEYNNHFGFNVSMACRAYAIMHRMQFFS